MELISEKALSSNRLNANLPYSFWSSGATIKARANSTNTPLMVRCKWKGIAFGNIGALLKAWLKEAKAPLTLRNQLLFKYRASPFNQALQPTAKRGG